jgi:DNA-binding MarR family transcriptional regulator
MKASRAARAPVALSPSKPRAFVPPPTITHPALLEGGRDDQFRQALYVMVLAQSRLETCREAFGKAMGLTGMQFAVMMGVAYQQKRDGVTIRALSDHVQLASTHVTTEVGVLTRKGLLSKRPHPTDRRSVLVSLTREGEEAIRSINPLVRRVNDRLFDNVTKGDLASLFGVMTKIAFNSEYALAELRRSSLEQTDRGGAERLR